MSSRPRVSIILRDLDHGGIERVMLGVADYLSRSSLQVDLIAFEARGALRSMVPEGVAFWDLARTSSFGLNPYRFALTLGALRRQLALNPPHVVLCAKEQANLIAFIACRMLPKKPNLIVTRHSPISVNIGGADTSRTTELVYRHLYSHAQSVVAVSDGLVNDLKEHMPQRSWVRMHRIFNPVVDGEFFERAAVEPDDWPKAEGEVVVCVGRMTMQKGMDLLLQAFAMTTGRNQILLLVGDGAERSCLEQQAQQLGIRDRVVFAGARQNALPYIRKADCLVLPSRYEGLGNVLVEALALDTPVIAFDCPVGPREVLAGGRFGMLLEPENVESLASALMDLKALPRPLLAGFDSAPYRTQHVGEQYERLIRSLANGL